MAEKCMAFLAGIFVGCGVAFAEPSAAEMRFSVQVVDVLAQHCVTGYVGLVWTNHFIELSGKARTFTPGSQLNSNGPNIAPVVNTNLAEQFHLDLPFPGTWRVYYLGYSGTEKGFNCFYTPEEIRGESVGTPINWCLKYNTESGQYFTGSTKVAKDSATYVAVINGDLKNLTEFDPASLPEVEPEPGSGAALPVATLNYGKPFNLIVFGDFVGVGGDFRECVLVWGNAAITNMSVASAYIGDVCSSRDALIIGGDFRDGLGDAVQGNIVFGGDRMATQQWYNVAGNYQQFHQFPIALNEYGNVSPTGAVTAAVMRRDVVAVATNLASLAANGTNWMNEYSIRVLYGTNETRNVFAISEEQWRDTIDIQVPSNSQVVVNIGGGSVTNKLADIQINGDSNAGFGLLGAVTNVVFNFYAATNIVIGTGGCAPNMNGFFLAPFANVEWHGGNAYGPVVVGGNLTCGTMWFECQGYNGYGYGLTLGNETVTTNDTPPAKGSEGDIMVNRPDFAVTAMDWIVKPTLTGDVMVASITVANRGQLAADSGTLSVYRSAPAVVATGTEGELALHLGVLKPGELTNVVVTLYAAPEQGTHHLRAFIDSWDEVLEWSNGDNQSELTYSVDPISLSVQVLGDGVHLAWNNFWGQTYAIQGTANLAEAASWKDITGYGAILSARPAETNEIVLPFDSTEGCTFFKLRVVR